MRPHVLVLSDDETLRTMLHRAASDCQCIPHWTDTVAEASALLTVVRPPPFLLVDLGLQDGARTPLIRWYRLREQNARILVLSGNCTPASIVECMRAGADDFLGKPFPLSDLRRLLRAHVIESLPGSTPASPEGIALITKSPLLHMAIERATESRIQSLEQWPSDERTLDRFAAVVCDLRVVSSNQWSMLASYSKRLTRPPLIAIDDTSVPRTRLASVAFDECRDLDTGTAGLRDLLERFCYEARLRRIRDHLKDHLQAPRAVGRMIDEILCGDRLIQRVGTAARRIAEPESTLRRQWSRSVRGSLTLRDFVKTVWAARYCRDLSRLEGLLLTIGAGPSDGRAPEDTSGASLH